MKKTFKYVSLAVLISDTMRNKCPECGSEKIRRAFKETMCNACGLILTDERVTTGKLSM